MVTRRQHDEADRREQAPRRVAPPRVEVAETRVDHHASGLVERRTNDTNATGDRPMRETSGDLERQTLNRGGTLERDCLTATEASPRGGAAAGAATIRQENR